MSRLINVVAGATLAFLAGCQPQSSSPFAFLDRVNDPSITSKQKKVTVDEMQRLGVPYTVFEDVEWVTVPDQLKRDGHVNAPGIVIQSIEKRSMGFTDPNPALARQYTRYAEDIITWVRKHPDLAGLPNPPLEYLVTGEDTSATANIPCRVGLFQSDHYIFHASRTMHGKTDKEIIQKYLNENNASASGLIDVHHDGKGNVQLKKSDIEVRLSTGRAELVPLLMSPLSEYLPIMLQDGVKKHFDYFAGFSNGVVPQANAGMAFGQIIGGMESVSEALSAGLVIEYIQQSPIKNHLPPDITDQIIQFVRTKMPLKDPVTNKYGYVPATFDWTIAEGVRAVALTYTTNTNLFLNKLQEFENKRK